jgi:transketolase
LAGEGIAVRVVSMPSWDLFEGQDEAYRAEVLPPGLPAVSVEAASTFGWARYARVSVGIDHFGASAPGAVALDKLGINPAAVVAAAHRALGR